MYTSIQSVDDVPYILVNILVNIAYNHLIAYCTFLQCMTAVCFIKHACAASSDVAIGLVGCNSKLTLAANQGWLIDELPAQVSSVSGCQDATCHSAWHNNESRTSCLASLQTHPHCGSTSASSTCTYHLGVFSTINTSISKVQCEETRILWAHYKHLHHVSHFHTTTTALKQLGLSHDTVKTLLLKLHEQSITCLHNIVTSRRVLKRTQNSKVRTPTP